MSFSNCFVLDQPRKAGNHPMTEKLMAGSLSMKTNNKTLYPLLNWSNPRRQETIAQPLKTQTK